MQLKKEFFKDEKNINYKYINDTNNNLEYKSNLSNNNSINKISYCKTKTLLLKNNIISNIFFLFLIIISFFQTLSYDYIDIYTKTSGNITLQDIEGDYYSSYSTCSFYYRFFKSGIYFFNCTVNSNKNVRIALYNYKDNFTQMFKNNYNIISIDLSGVSYSYIKDTSAMFENCIFLESINFGNFKTTNVVNMSRMFYNCPSLRSINFNNFNTINVKDMSYMFTHSKNLSFIDLTNFNTYKVTNMSHMFSNCTNLTSILFKNFNNFITSNVIDMSYMFDNCIKLNELDLTNFDTSQVKDMKNMFEYCLNMNNLKQNFITSSVTNMEFMFSNCQKLKSLDISNFDLSSVTTMNSIFKDCRQINPIKLHSIIDSFSLINMASMFSGCESLISLDLTKFDTSLVKFMQELFKDCKSLEYLNISSFNTEKVIKMESMFENCYKLKNLNLKNFYTPSLRQLYNMFYNCVSLTSIDISDFDTYQVTNFAYLFYNCYSLQNLSLDNIYTNVASDFSYMFYNCSKLTSLDLTNFETKRVEKMNSMFEGCSSLEEIKIDIFLNTQTNDISKMFYGCSNLININLSQFYTNEVKNMDSLFYGCSSLTFLNLSNFVTNNTVNMNSMFAGCSSVIDIDLSSFNTINVKDMSSMFSGCKSLLSLDITLFQTNNLEKAEAMFKNCRLIKNLFLNNFNTSNIVSMKSMFYGCNSLEKLDLSKFKTNKVIYMDGIFYGCNSLIMLDLSNFVFSNVVNMGYMFYGCNSLTSIILPNLRNLIVTNTSYMFAGCSSIKEIDLTNFDTHNVLSFDYMFSECAFLKNINLNKLNTKSVRSMDYMFAGCSSLTSLDILNFETPSLESTKGMFYGCSSLTNLNLSKLNTSSVINTAYMFYKATSLKSINFLLPEEDISLSSDKPKREIYFDTSLVTNMRYMLSSCSNMEKLDLSFMNTKSVMDMSYMLAECTNLTSVNLSSFKTSNVVTMEGMFYNDFNLSYLNLLNASDNFLNNIYYIFENTPVNGVFCIKEQSAKKIYDEIIKTKNCYIINCESDAPYFRKKMDFVTHKCINDCGEELKYEYRYMCYDECPNDTYVDKFKCIPLIREDDECTIQRLLLSECDLDKYHGLYNNTKEEKILFIDNILVEINIYNLEEIISKAVKGEDVVKNIYNETYHFSPLSNSQKLPGLIHIDVQDCENILKLKNDLDPDEEFFIFIIEYNNDEFRIPIVEYKVFSRHDRREIDVSPCNSMNFIYSIPISSDKINLKGIYMHEPESDYNNEICFQYTTEYKTDIILYERRKIFNENNMSLCENNCIYQGYDKGRIKCKCQVKLDFNKFLQRNDSEKDNYIFKFTNNKLQKYNFEVLKCFKILFSKAGIKGNIISILYITLMGINIILLIIFCVRDYRSLYFQIRWLSHKESMQNKKKNKLNKNKNKEIVRNNIIKTSANPPKIKSQKKVPISDQLNINKLGKQLDNKDEGSKESGQKVNAPSSLIDSRNVLNKVKDNTLELNKVDNSQENDWDEFLVVDKDMEINLLSYSEAVKKDKRFFLLYYFSLIKSRHLLVSIFINDYNSLIMKICFCLFIFGISLGINTIFFTDKSIQKIYEGKGQYNLSQNIYYHIIPILISTFATLIIKSIISLIIYSDAIILKLKENNALKSEDKMNEALIKTMSRGTILFIVNFIVIIIFWFYMGSFCAVFKNTQIYLIINGIITFILVIVIPFLYYFIPTLLRTISLRGKNNQCLYRVSQFIQLF